MTGRWDVRIVNHLHDEWQILFDGTTVGQVAWLRSLRFPHLTKNRIRDGLNGVHGAAQPSRTWSFGPETSAGCWLLLHNGVTVGEVAWQRIPPVDPDVWQDHILAGLNWWQPGDRVTPPEPAAPLARAS